MTDRRQHAGAVGDEADEALLHPVEGGDQPPCLVGTGLAERRRRGAAAEGVGAVGERLQGPGHPPGDEDDDGEARHRHDRRREKRGEGEGNRLRPDLRLGVQPTGVVEGHRGDHVERCAAHAPGAIRIAVTVHPEAAAVAAAGAGVIQPDQSQARWLAQAFGEHVLERMGKHHPACRCRGLGESALLGRPEAQARRAGGLGEPHPLACRYEIEHAGHGGDLVEEPEPVGFAHRQRPLVDEQEQAHRQRAEERDEEKGEKLAAQRLREKLHAAGSSTSAAKL